jgi:DNA-binding HxlR family transcriptional regulator
MVKTPQCTCPNATALFTLIGKKWTIFILRAIDEGAHSFTEIRKNIGDANTKILTDRLHELVESGIVAKSESGEYSLSKKGDTLSSKLIDLAGWWGGEKR